MPRQAPLSSWRANDNSSVCPWRKPSAIVFRSSGWNIALVRRPDCPATGIYENGCSDARRLEVPDKSAKMAIDSSDAMDARDDLLANVATFVKINCDPIETNFLRQRILGKFAVPARETAFDPQ